MQRDIRLEILSNAVSEAAILAVKLAVKEQTGQNVPILLIEISDDEEDDDGDKADPVNIDVDDLNIEVQTHGNRIKELFNLMEEGKLLCRGGKYIPKGNTADTLGSFLARIQQQLNTNYQLLPIANEHRTLNNKKLARVLPSDDKENNQISSGNVHS